MKRERTGPEGRGAGSRCGWRWRVTRSSSARGTRVARLRRRRGCWNTLTRLRPPLPGGEGKEGLPITGAANADAVSEAEAVLLAVPFEGLRPTAESLREALAGRLVVSIVAPVEFVDGQMRAVSVPEGSAGELTRDLLPESRVAAAFQNMSARDLLRADHPLEGDVAVTADDESARRETMALAEAMPSLRAVDAGPLSNSRYVEELTALLVNLNRIHKAHSTIRFLGL